MEVKERVNHLEELMANLMATVQQTSHEVRELQRHSSQEMAEFKVEMRTSFGRFEREMQASRERSEREMAEFKVEMRTSFERFEREMQASREHSKQEMAEFKKSMDKKWGELSQKLGSMTEDLVAPNVPRIMRQVTQCEREIEFQALRVKRSQPKNQEFDLVVVCGDYVLISETKSSLAPEDIKDFAALMSRARDWFPEYAARKFIGAIASLYLDPSLVRYGEKQGLVVLGFGEELMEVLNSRNFTPRCF